MTTRNSKINGGFGQSIILLCVWCALTTMLTGCATTDSELLLSQQQRLLNIESFDYVWNTIRDKHWDPDLNGADWDSARAELRPQVEQATTISAARGHIVELISRLQQTHFEIIPGESLLNSDSAPEASGGGDVGLTVQIVEGRATVVKVRPGTSAADAQVHPGWIITRIGELDVTERLADITALYEGKSVLRLGLSEVARNGLRGPVGQNIEVEFLDNQDQAVTEVLRLGPCVGHAFQLGDLPEMFATFEAREIDDRFGYVGFSWFMAPGFTMTNFNEAMQEFMDTEGFVLDLRGNRGGIGPMALGCAGWFIADDGKKKKLGTMYTRTMETAFILRSRPDTYSGPMAILIDGQSASTTEILAGGLQDLGRARVFGHPSAGAALPATFERLPNGDSFMYAIANYISDGGYTLEGRGVIPDVAVEPTRESVLAGQDVALEAALEWLRSEADENK